MAVAGLEWVVIGVILVILILWGPTQIPKIARAFGQAKKEFQKASQETERTVREAQEIAREATEPFKETIQTATREMSDMERDLMSLARQLGIKTEGKTKEQIASEIAKKLKKS